MKKVELSALLKQIQPESPGFKLEGQLLFIDPINSSLRAQARASNTSHKVGQRMD